MTQPRYDLIVKWGPTSDNQLVCDLNLDTKNTVKNKMQGSLGASYLDDAYDSKYGSLDFDDLGQYSTEVHCSAYIAHLFIVSRMIRVWK
jgi:hypothetical protein